MSVYDNLGRIENTINEGLRNQPCERMVGYDGFSNDTLFPEVSVSDTNAYVLFLFTIKQTRPDWSIRIKLRFFAGDNDADGKFSLTANIYNVGENRDKGDMSQFIDLDATEAVHFDKDDGGGLLVEMVSRVKQASTGFPDELIKGDILEVKLKKTNDFSFASGTLAVVSADLFYWDDNIGKKRGECINSWLWYFSIFIYDYNIVG